MLRIIKKILIILLLIFVNTIVKVVKIIHNFLNENKSDIKNIYENFNGTLREELDK